MGQKSLLRKVLAKMKNEYNSIENKLLEKSVIDTEQIDLTIYKNGFTETLMQKLVENEIKNDEKTLNSSEAECPPQEKPKVNKSTDNMIKVKLSQNKNKIKVNNRLSRNNSNNLKLNVCKICEDTKSVRNQMGVKVCGACKKFFDKFNKKTVPECVLDGNCIIKTETRNHCKFCRFQKCVKVGMTANKSLESKREKTPNKRPLESKTNKNSSVMKDNQPKDNDDMNDENFGNIFDKFEEKSNF